MSAAPSDSGDADAGGESVAAGRQVDGRVRDSDGQAVRAVDRVERARELLAEDDELIAAEPGERVGSGCRGRELRRHCDQRLVAGLVAE